MFSSRIGEAYQEGRREQPDLRAETGPEDGVEPDAPVPQRVGPQVEPEAEQHEDEQER